MVRMGRRVEERLDDDALNVRAAEVGREARRVRQRIASALGKHCFRHTGNDLGTVPNGHPVRANLRTLQTVYIAVHEQLTRATVLASGLDDTGAPA